MGEVAEPDALDPARGRPPRAVSLHQAARRSGQASTRESRTSSGATLPATSSAPRSRRPRKRPRPRRVEAPRPRPRAPRAGPDRGRSAVPSAATSARSRVDVQPDRDEGLGGAPAPGGAGWPVAGPSSTGVVRVVVGRIGGRAGGRPSPIGARRPDRPRPAAGLRRRRRLRRDIAAAGVERIDEVEGGRAAPTGWRPGGRTATALEQVEQPARELAAQPDGIGRPGIGHARRPGRPPESRASRPASGRVGQAVRRPGSPRRRGRRRGPAGAGRSATGWSAAAGPRHRRTG